MATIANRTKVLSVKGKIISIQTTESGKK